MSPSKTSPIKFNVIGKILQGDDVGCYIRVVHDEKDTGGFYIFQSDSIDFKSTRSFDAWVESIGQLQSFFEESSWEIEWLE